MSYTGDRFDCPKCGGLRSHLTDSRALKSRTVRRRRECDDCGERYTTYEVRKDRMHEHQERYMLCWCGSSWPCERPENHRIMAPDIHPSSDVVSRARVRTILAKMLFAPMEHLCLDDGRSEGEVFNKRVRAAAHSLGVDIDK